MSLETEAVASATIELLEGRLRRLEYLLTGDTQWTGKSSTAPKPDTLEDTVARRLTSLERTLNSLSKSNPAVRDVLQLYSRFPDLFPGASTHEDTIPADLSTQNLASIVLSYATAFPETASRLSSLKDLPIPDAQASTALIELQPRLQKLLSIQEQQAIEISELRKRSARLLQRWYELGVLRNSECWAEWESRLEDIEREVKRREVIHDRREREI
ncbi:nuclear distribution protein RO10, putative [Talaromyces stipitatus ATCC 10500]|uniref:Nuclear distribution protein RO10, putative n=1 Tax=Talaromyces stipitatus (strain ATCC 10500 / CBS 375.48 / QM 6759 / NRRL 1006) TaxID=441959 RepID=B8MD75_TALSN|nr:nuclear distribution protein RO10, putative [Talaromyces stipitatus ATCC 10500]EED17600.1 nuclear distribution protein RO10, putative [Talaromyces stipitatus ATCC 10500]